MSVWDHASSGRGLTQIQWKSEIHPRGRALGQVAPLIISEELLDPGLGRVGRIPQLDALVQPSPDGKSSRLPWD